jgi:hypothetical protein
VVQVQVLERPVAVAIAVVVVPISSIAAAQVATLAAALLVPMVQRGGAARLLIPALAAMSPVAL